jgi:hypothetical protein
LPTESGASLDSPKALTSELMARQPVQCPAAITARSAPTPSAHAVKASARYDITQADGYADMYLVGPESSLAARLSCEPYQVLVEVLRRFEGDRMANAIEPRTFCRLAML